MIDLTYELNREFIIYPNNPAYSLTRVSDMEQGDSCNVSELHIGTHMGTHIDAPLHFIPNGKSIAEIPLDRMNGKAIVVSIKNPLHITREEIITLPLQKDSIVIFRTQNTDVFWGQGLLEEYVTLTYDAAEYLAEKEVKLVGIDYLTIECPKKHRRKGKSIHKTLLGAGILIVEGLNLKSVQDGEYQFFCLPLKLNHADGCPVRAVLVP